MTTDKMTTDKMTIDKTIVNRMTAIMTYNKTTTVLSLVLTAKCI